MKRLFVLAAAAAMLVSAAAWAPASACDGEKKDGAAVAKADGEGCAKKAEVAEAKDEGCPKAAAEGCAKKAEGCAKKGCDKAKKAAEVAQADTAKPSEPETK